MLKFLKLFFIVEISTIPIPTFVRIKQYRYFHLGTMVQKTDASVILQQVCVP